MLSGSPVRSPLDVLLLMLNLCMTATRCTQSCSHSGGGRAKAGKAFFLEKFKHYRVHVWFYPRERQRNCALKCPLSEFEVLCWNSHLGPRTLISCRTWHRFWLGDSVGERCLPSGTRRPFPQRGSPGGAAVIFQWVVLGGRGVEG